MWLKWIVIQAKCALNHFYPNILMSNMLGVVCVILNASLCLGEYIGHLCRSGKFMFSAAVFGVHHDSAQIPSASGVNMLVCTQAGLFLLLSVSHTQTHTVPLSYIRYRFCFNALLCSTGYASLSSNIWPFLYCHKWRFSLIIHKSTHIIRD